MVRALIETGRAQVNACDSDGRCALRAAVFGSHEPLARYLIRRAGANVHKLDADMRSILHAAAYTAHLPTCKLLVAHGAHLDHVDKHCQSVIFTCLFAPHGNC